LVRNRYFRTIGNREWGFFATQKAEGGETKVIDLLYMSTVKIVRHTKIRGNANPYDSGWQEYFLNVQLELIILRSNRRLVANRTTGSPLCRGWPLKGLSRMTVTCHVRFLGGLGAAMPPGYPVFLGFGQTTISGILHNF